MRIEVEHAVEHACKPGIWRLDTLGRRFSSPGVVDTSPTRQTGAEVLTGQWGSALTASVIFEFSGSTRSMHTTSSTACCRLLVPFEGPFSNHQDAHVDLCIPVRQSFDTLKGCKMRSGGRHSHLGSVRT